MFVYFIGVKSTEELKLKYKELAKKFHPDMGGSTAEFQAMAAEFQKIKTNAFISYPIANKTTQSNPFENAFRGDPANAYDWARNYYRSNAQQEEEEREKAKKEQAARDFAAKQARMREEREREAREKAAAEQRRNRERNSETRKIIISLIAEANEKEKSVNWMLMEIYKLDNLSLDDFRWIRTYIAEVSNRKVVLHEQWVNASYKNYVAIHTMEWRYNSEEQKDDDDYYNPFARRSRRRNPFTF